MAVFEDFFTVDPVRNKYWKDQAPVKFRTCQLESRQLENSSNTLVSNGYYRFRKKQDSQVVSCCEVRDESPSLLYTTWP